MPFIQGQTLQEAIDELHRDESISLDASQRSLRFRRLLQRFITVCNTIAYAHDQGIVHRDLKPLNIMLGPYGETLVMDWGLAKSFGTDDGDIEVEGEHTVPQPFAGRPDGYRGSSGHATVYESRTDQGRAGRPC